MRSPKDNNRLKALALAAFLPLCSQLPADFVIPGSVVNGTIDGSNPAPGATDVDYLTYMRIVTNGVTTDRISFVVDLEGAENIHGVALYGNYAYSAFIAMLSDDIRIEAGSSASGPWTEIGSINVGSTRPTDPDPTIGGENPFTGGNGRLVPCDGTAASFLRISGGQGFDNNIDVYQLQVNPRVVIHQTKPVYNGVSNNPVDIGGGTANSRAIPDLVDGLFNTRAFIGSPTDLVLDLGTAGPVKELRVHTSESDDFTLVRTGVIKTSSTDSPANFDTTLTTFDTGGGKSTAVIALPGTPNKRFFQFTPLTNQAGQTPNGSAATFRFSEIDYRTVDELPVSGATVASFTGATEDPSDPASSMFDLDYNERATLTQTAGPLEVVMSLGSTREVRSIALYGDWAYRNTINMFSDVVTVEAGSSATGPWTVVGSENFGNTRPTDPNPTIGGENGFTGGNGRRIAVTPTLASHLRVTGGFGFDSPILIYEAQINPVHVLHTVSPVDQGQTLWDFGGGPLNSRVGAEAVDSNLNTRINPRIAYTFTLDVAPEPVKIKEIRIFPMDNDIPQLPKTGVVRTSSSDNPQNMDTVETTFNVSITGGMAVIPVASLPTKRYVQIEFLTGQTVSVPRVGEIEVIHVPAVITGGPSAVENWQLLN